MASWSFLEACWQQVEGSWEVLGSMLGCFWQHVRLIFGIILHIGGYTKNLQISLIFQWFYGGGGSKIMASWGFLEACWQQVEGSWGYFGISWLEVGGLGAILDSS